MDEEEVEKEKMEAVLRAKPKEKAVVDLHYEGPPIDPHASLEGLLRTNIGWLKRVSSQLSDQGSGSQAAQQSTSSADRVVGSVRPRGHPSSTYIPRRQSLHVLLGEPVQ